MNLDDTARLPRICIELKLPHHAPLVDHLRNILIPRGLNQTSSRDRADLIIFDVYDPELKAFYTHDKGKTYLYISEERALGVPEDIPMFSLYSPDKIGEFVQETLERLGWGSPVPEVDPAIKS
jgi:hypothetical protein